MALRRLNPWIFSLSYGGLIAPTAEFLKIIKDFEETFNKINGASISREKNIMKQIIDTLHLLHPHVPLDVVKIYAKTRISIRIRYLNYFLKAELASIRARNSVKNRHYTS